MVQWLRLCTPSAGGPSSIPGQGTRSHMTQIKIPHAVAKTWCSQINKCLKKYNKVRYSHDTKKKDDRAHGKLVAIHIHPHAVHIFFLFCTLKKKKTSCQHFYIDLFKCSVSDVPGKKWQ